MLALGVVLRQANGPVGTVMWVCAGNELQAGLLPMTVCILHGINVTVSGRKWVLEGKGEKILYVTMVCSSPSSTLVTKSYSLVFSFSL